MRFGISVDGKGTFNDGKSTLAATIKGSSPQDRQFLICLAGLMTGRASEADLRHVAAYLGGEGIEILEFHSQNRTQDNYSPPMLTEEPGK